MAAIKKTVVAVTKQRREVEKRKQMITIENVGGFLYLALAIVGAVGALIAALSLGNAESEEEEIQSFIDGIEFAIDNGLDVPEEDYQEYLRLTEGRKQYED